MTTIEVVCYKYKPLKNKELPLKIRICKDRKTRYVNLGVSTKSENWDFQRNQPKADSPNKEHLEKLISNKISELRGKIVELKSEDKEFTAKSLIERIASNPHAMTVKALFEKHIDDLLSENRSNYALSIRQTYNSLLDFNKHLDIYFSEIDLFWLKRYETWLRKQDKSENTIGIRFRNIRMLFNLAIEMELVKPECYPFQKYKVSKLHENTAKRALAKDEILQIINFTGRVGDKYAALAIDLFTFSYFMGGINFVDMAYLTESNIIDGRLIYKRKKTSKLINLPLQERALLVLKEYEGKNKPYLFPIFSSLHKTEQQKLNRLHKVISKVNKELKAIGKELNIPIKLTTYVARHSYATVLKRAGVSTSIISESLGHSSEKITQIYLDSFENSQIDQALKFLK